MEGGPRTATVRADGAVECLRLGQGPWLEFMGQCTRPLALNHVASTFAEQEKVYEASNQGIESAQPRLRVIYAEGVEPQVESEPSETDAETTPEPEERKLHESELEAEAEPDLEPELEQTELELEPGPEPVQPVPIATGLPAEGEPLATIGLNDAIAVLEAKQAVMVAAIRAEADARISAAEAAAREMYKAAEARLISSIAVK